MPEHPAQAIRFIAQCLERIIVHIHTQTRLSWQLNKTISKNQRRLKQALSTVMTALANQQIWNRCHHMHRRCHPHRSGGIVRRNRHIVNLCHPRDLFQFQNTPTMANIRLQNRAHLPLNEFAESPARQMPFTRGNRHSCAPGQRQ